MPMTRHHPLWFAYILHRVSGLLLALFLPVHFYVLAMAVTDPAGLDSFLAFAEIPAVKFAEIGLVFLLAVHMFGGLRLIALEQLSWTSRQKTYAAASVALACFTACLFALRAI